MGLRQNQVLLERLIVTFSAYLGTAIPVLERPKPSVDAVLFSCQLRCLTKCAFVPFDNLATISVIVSLGSRIAEGKKLVAREDGI